MKMKNTLSMSKVIFLTLLVLISVSCNESSAQEQEMAEEQNARLVTSPQKEESTFFVAIAENELADLEAAKLAAKKCTNAEVKKFASRLVVDHIKSSLQLKELAYERNIALPTSLTDDEKGKYNKLSANSASNFDKQFLNEMIDDYKKSIKNIEVVSADRKDQRFKDWSTNKTGTLIAQLMKANMLKEKLNYN